MRNECAAIARLATPKSVFTLITRGFGPGRFLSAGAERQASSFDSTSWRSACCSWRRRAGAADAGAGGHLLAPARRRRHLAHRAGAARRSLLAHGLRDALARPRVAVAAAHVRRLSSGRRDAGAGDRRGAPDPGGGGDGLSADGRAAADALRAHGGGAADRLQRLVVAAAAPDAVSAAGAGLACWRASDFVFLPPYFLVWANAHGGVALGGVVLGGVHGGAPSLRWWRTRAPGDRRRAWRWRSCCRSSALAVAATPLGFHIYRFVVSLGRALLRGADRRVVHAAAGLPASASLFWAATLAFALVIVVRRRAIAARRLDRLGVGGRGAGAHAAGDPFGAQHRSVLDPGDAGRQPRARARRFAFGCAAARVRPAPITRALNLALLLGLGAARAGGGGLAWRARAAARSTGVRSPPAALRALDRCPGPLYNFYGDGGSLVWFAPERQDFVDGRQDPFPFWLLRQSFAVEHGAPYRPLFARFGVRCAFIPAKSKLDRPACAPTAGRAATSTATGPCWRRRAEPTCPYLSLVSCPRP